MCITSPVCKLKLVSIFSAVVVDWILCQMGNLFFVKQLDLLAHTFQVFQRVLALEELTEEHFQDLFYLLFLSNCDVAADSGPAKKHDHRQFKHFCVVQKEAHVRHTASIFSHQLLVCQVNRKIFLVSIALEVLIAVDLHIVHLERSVCAEELVLAATSTFKLF